MSDPEKLRITITLKEPIDAFDFIQSIQALEDLHEAFCEEFSDSPDSVKPKLSIKISEGSIVIAVVDFVQYLQQMPSEETERYLSALSFLQNFIDTYIATKCGVNLPSRIKEIIRKNAPKCCAAIKNFMNPARQEGNNMQISSDTEELISIDSKDTKTVDQRMDKEIKNLTEHEGPPPRTSHESSGFSR